MFSKTILFAAILFVLFSAPGVSTAQPFDGHVPIDQPGIASPGLLDGGFHFHTNPADDHYAFESLERDTYQYRALHGYKHNKGDELRRMDRFEDIRYPKNKPDSRPGSDSFFGVKSHNPLKW
ncbi:MAG: hypothetical protein ACM335_11430 [Deltaproteobacteria bacterium]